MKINMKVVILSILITLLIYPTSIKFLTKTANDIYIASKLNNTEQQTKSTVDDKKVKLVFIFDDGWETVFTEAYEVMDKYGYKACVSVIPSQVDKAGYMSYQKLSDLYLKGWDLLNHSYSHKENVYNNPEELLSDFNKARQWMDKRHLGSCSDMIIVPYGDANPYIVKQMKAAKYRNIRTSDNIILLDKYETEYYPVHTINLLTDVTANEAIQLVNQTTNEHKAVIFILHKIEDRYDEFGMTYSKNKLEQIIKYINEHSDKLQVVTYSQLFE